MEKTIDYFKTFCNISRAFATTLNNEELLDLIVKSAKETMETKAASLYLRSEDADEIIPVAHTGLSEEYVKMGRTRPSKMMDILTKEGYIASLDAQNDKRLDNPEMKEKEGIASILIVPVVYQNNYIGILAVFTADQREFTENEIEFLKALAEQGGMAIQNARLVERMKQNAILFHDLVDSINSHLDVRKILHILTADITDSFGMKGVSIFLENRKTGNLELVATYGLSENFISKGPISKDKSINAAINGETVIISDATKDPRIQYRDAMKKEGILSMLCVPVHSRDDIIGVMRLYSSVKRDFPEDMVILVEALAHQGGIAINNATIYLMLEEDKKNLEEEIWSHRMWF